jgi:hypothetical protein
MVGAIVVGEAAAGGAGDQSGDLAVATPTQPAENTPTSAFDTTSLAVAGLAGLGLGLGLGALAMRSRRRTTS